MDQGPDSYEENLAQRDQEWDDNPAGSITHRAINEMHELIDEVGLLHFNEEIYDRFEDFSQYTDPEEKHWRYHFPSVARTLVFTVLAVACFLVQGFVHGWNAAAGNPLGANTGYVRMGIMFAGAVFALIAWPRWTPRDRAPSEWDKEMEERRRAKAEFHERSGDRN